MIIQLKEPEGPYKCVIDTEVMEVELRKAFLGVRLITEDGEQLIVQMRDSGFEIEYLVNYGKNEFDVGPIELKNGIINIKGTNR